jgi:hypothetical protein
MGQHKPKKSGSNTQKLKAIPELSLEDDDSELARRHGPKAKLKGGYDPYDRDPLASKKLPPGKQPSTDLRKLSEWIRLKREVEELRQQDEAEALARRKARGE